MISALEPLLDALYISTTTTTTTATTTAGQWTFLTDTTGSRTSRQANGRVFVSVCPFVS